jgi:hypothetical protein
MIFSILFAGVVFRDVPGASKVYSFGACTILPGHQWGAREWPAALLQGVLANVAPAGAGVFGAGKAASGMVQRGRDTATARADSVDIAQALR